MGVMVEGVADSETRSEMETGLLDLAICQISTTVMWHSHKTTDITGLTTDSSSLGLFFSHAMDLRMLRCQIVGLNQTYQFKLDAGLISAYNGACIYGNRP